MATFLNAACGNFGCTQHRAYVKASNQSDLLIGAFPQNFGSISFWEVQASLLTYRLTDSLTYRLTGFWLTDLLTY